VLPIGGVKEKVLAAYRFGIKTVIMPKENEKDLSEIPDDIRAKLEFRLVENMDEVLETAMAESIPTLEIGETKAEKRIDDAAADESVTH
jgi:ATP-dependent Lon protease